MSFLPARVLVPVAVGFNDDVALAEQLVDAAIDVARGDGATLVIVHITGPAMLPAVAVDTGFTPPAYYQAMADLQAADRDNAAATLEKLGRRVTARGLRVKTEVLEPFEGVGEAIAHAAVTHDADLIALWSHGRRGLRRLFLGSVAERVAHIATRPLLILRTPPT